MQEGKFSIDIDYSKITKIYYLKYSYVLMFTTANGIILKYDSFTKGNFEDFKEFIKENCKKAKIIIKNKNYMFGLYKRVQFTTAPFLFLFFYYI